MKSKKQSTALEMAQAAASIGDKWLTESPLTLVGVPRWAHVLFAHVEDSKPDSDKDAPPVGALLVPVRCPNAHNYALNSPMLITVPGAGEGSLRLDGTPGNCPPRGRTSYRCATWAEIKKATARLFGECPLCAKMRR